jgi:hypothetical protein
MWVPDHGSHERLRVRSTPIDAVHRMLTAEERGFTRALYAVMHYVSEVGDLVPQRRSAVLH